MAGGITDAQTSDSFNQSITGAFIFGVKAGPNDGPSYPFFNNSPGFSAGYWFQPRRWLALEAGFEQIVRPIGSSICCEYSQNAAAELYLVPFGARYVWQPSKLRLSIGGGGAYLNHTIGNTDGDVIGFAGWGGQVVTSVDYAITRRLRAGFTARYYFASPRSDVPDIPSTHTHFFTLGPAVTFSFGRR